MQFGNVIVAMDKVIGTVAMAWLVVMVLVFMFIDYDRRWIHLVGGPNIVRRVDGVLKHGHWTMVGRFGQNMMRQLTQGALVPRLVEDVEVDRIAEDGRGQ